MAQFNLETNFLVSDSSIPSGSIKYIYHIATLVNQNLKADNHTYTWNASGFASGVYYYRIVADSYGEAGEYIETRKMILLR